MKWGLVTYSNQDTWKKEIQQVSSALGTDSGLVVNNCFGEAGLGEIQGHNEQFEFGGYLTLCERMEGDGPFVIMNDTLFRTHDTKGWLELLQQIPQLDADRLVVYGDIRKDGSELIERPDPFLASWIFVLPNRVTLEVLQSGLKAILAEDVRPLSAEYEAFLQRWLNPTGIMGGWHGKKGDDELRRKRQCVIWEHRLSKWLLDAGVELSSMGEWNSRKYQWLRIKDRLKTRYKAWMG